MAEIVALKVFPQAGMLLRCRQCGATGAAPCACGPEYLEYVPAGKFAAEAVKSNPEMSDRAIAEKTGVAKDTSRRARVPTGANEPVGKTRRVGRNRKTYAAPQALTTREQVIAIFKQHRGGLTASAAAAKLPNIHSQTVNTSVNALAREGYLFDSEKRKRLSKGGRPAIVYRYRAVPPQETMSDAEYTDWAEEEHDNNPRNLYAAYLIRVDQARAWAKLGYDGKVTDEIIALARAAGRDWNALADKLEAQRRRK